MTLPMIVGLVAVIGFNAVDTYFIGQLGLESLAAITYTFPVVFVLATVALGLGTGATSIVSRAVGEGDQDRVRALATDSLTLAVAIVGVLVVVGVLTIEPVFRLLGAEGAELERIRQYMLIWYLGMPFLVVPMVGNGVIRAIGDAKVPGAVMVVAAVANVILDPLLIFGVGPFPRMEMRGAALATVLARATTLAAALYVLSVRERLIVWRPRPFSAVLASWREILRVGGPAAATQAINPISIAVVTRLVASHGSVAVAAFGAATRVDALAMIPFSALAAGMAPVAGQNWGAGLRDRVREGLHWSGVYSLAWAVVTVVGLALLGPAIVGRFSDDPDVRSLAATYLRIVPASHVLYGVMIITSATFNAIGRPLSASVIMITRMVVLYVPIAYAGSRLVGPVGIFAAAAISNAGAGILAFVWSRRVCAADPSPAQSSTR